MSWKKGNTFETVAFTSFGFFWVSFAFILIAPFGLTTSSAGLGLYLILWGLLSFFLLLGTLKLKVKALIVIFTLLVTTFFITAIPALVTVPAIVGTIAAISTLLLGLASCYAAMAIVLNDVGYKLPL
jgi:succinate-acetate transporter protein